MTLSIAESLLPQPPSFQKKKAYEIHKVLGVGTFGKVMVRIRPCGSFNTSFLTPPSAHWLLQSYRYVYHDI